MGMTFKSKHFLLSSLPILASALAGCSGIPNGVRSVESFDANRYMGTWYEIARLDNSFEKGLCRVEAQYSLNADGTIKVLNRGYSKERGAWSSAEGRARLIPGETGRLKVCFFWPFYGAYNII